MKSSIIYWTHCKTVVAVFAIGDLALRILGWQRGSDVNNHQPDVAANFDLLRACQEAHVGYSSGENPKFARWTLGTFCGLAGSTYSPENRRGQKTRVRPYATKKDFDQTAGATPPH